MDSHAHASIHAEDSCGANVFEGDDVCLINDHMMLRRIVYHQTL